MKEFVRSLSYLLSLELPVSKNTARWYAIGAYWFRLVPLHLLMILSAGVLTYAATGNGYPKYFGAAFLPVALLTICVLSVFLYLPRFVFDLLPSFQVTEPKAATPIPKEKCRQSQLSNPALCLVFHVLQKSSGMQSFPADDASAATLNQLFGVDPGSLKKNLRFFFGPASGRTHLSERKQTEIRNRFQEARAFFEGLSFPNGIQMLNDLEEKILS